MIRWLVVGAGHAGKCHIAAIDQVIGAELAGVVDTNADIDIAAPIFDNLAAAIAEAKPTAVIIATPNDTQLALARVAIEAGLPVLCEKPVCNSFEDAKTLANVSDQSNIPVGVVLNQRAQLHSRWIKGLIHSGVFAPEQIMFSASLPRLTGWHADPAKSGGGLLRTIGLHYIDLLIWWLGRPKLQHAKLSGSPQENNIDIALEFSAGCNAQIKMTAVHETGSGPVTCTLESESARLEMQGHEITSVDNLPEPPPLEPMGKGLFFGPGHYTVIEEVTASLVHSKSFPVSVTDVFPALSLIEEIYAADCS